MGNKQLDPPPLEKSWTPTPLENVGPPLEPLKMIYFIFLWNWPFDFCKISWGLKKTKQKKKKKKKKKNVVKDFFVRLTWTPLTKIPGSAHDLHPAIPSIITCSSAQLYMAMQWLSGKCYTRDQGAAGSNLTAVTALWSLSKTHLS